jgi:hypothetical protein
MAEKTMAGATGAAVVGARGSNIWFEVLRKVLEIPGAKIDREVFLEQEFSRFCNAQTISKMQETGTIKAGVANDVLDEVAKNVIAFHTTAVTAASFMSGLPGGIALALTIPADLVQYYYHLVICAQKLAYIYGLPDFDADNSETFMAMITVLVGTMSKVISARSELKTLTKTLEDETSKRLTYIVLGKAGILLLAKYAAQKLAITLFWRGYYRIALKIVPIVGGLASGGATVATFLPMVNTLKSELAKITVK